MASPVPEAGALPPVDVKTVDVAADKDTKSEVNGYVLFIKRVFSSTSFCLFLRLAILTSWSLR